MFPMTHNSVQDQDDPQQLEFDFDATPSPEVEHDPQPEKGIAEPTQPEREQVVLTLEPHIARLLRDAITMACDGKEVVVRTP